MTLPVITGQQCTATEFTTQNFEVGLPAWNPGDLAIVGVFSRAGNIIVPGDWENLTGQNLSGFSGRIGYRIMQPGDQNPIYSSVGTPHWVSMASVVQAGTYDPADPVGGWPGFDAWENGQGFLITANAVNTVENDSYAFAFACNRNGNQIVLTTPGWVVEIPNCVERVASDSLGGESARRPMPSPGAAGQAQWDIIAGASRIWMVAAGYINPSPAPSGVTVDVPLHTIAATEFPPTVETITQVNVPEATYTITAFVPRAGAGTLVRVPVNTANVQQYPPTLPEGDEVFVPLHIIPVTERIPEIRTGARIPVPTFPKSGTPFPPTVGVATLVRVPLNTLSPNNRVPSVGTGARVDIPELDTLTPIEYVPTVTATPGSFLFVPLNAATVQAFPPIIEVFVAEELPRIETDRDRLSLFVDEPSKLDFAGKSYLVVSAEVDGDTLDGGRTTDGYIEVLMLSSEAQNIPELATVRLNGVNRTVSKIYDREGGMALLYLT